MDRDQLQEILKKHQLWLNHKKNGERADLSRANLSGANLRWANLSGANLSRAKGLASAVEYLAAHFERTDKGYLAYKTFGSEYPPPEDWEISPESVISEVVNPDRCTGCGCGVNIAPLEWVQAHNSSNAVIWRVLIEWEWLPGVVVPYNTDGKIRCERVRLIEEVA